jgi:hypothetical protein
MEPTTRTNAIRDPGCILGHSRTSERLDKVQERNILLFPLESQDRVNDKHHRANQKKYSIH